MTRTEHIKEWVSNLTPEQIATLATELTNELIDEGTVRFWDNSLAPYWAATGYPLVEGQKTFEGE